MTLKLTPLMMSHIEEMSKPENQQYFASDIDPIHPKKPLVGIDLETPWIGGPEWTWDCKFTTWAFYTDSVQVMNHTLSLLPNRVGVYSTENGLVATYDESHREAIQWILDNCTTIWHNSNFDLSRLEQNNYRVPRPGEYQDTLCLAYVLNYRSKLPDLRLESLASLVGLTKVKATADDFTNVSTVVLERNISDAEITLRLFEYLRDELALDARVLAHYRYVDLPFTLIVREMENEGFYVDLDATRAYKEEVDAQYQALATELASYEPWIPSPDPIVRCWTEELSGTKVDKKTNNQTHWRLSPLFCPIAGELTPDEPIKVLDYSKPTKTGRPSVKSVRPKYAYAEEVGFKPTNQRHKLYVLIQQGWNPDEDAKRTESGMVSVDKETLQSLASKFPLARTFLACSKLSKIIGTYLEPLLRYSTEVSPNLGHIHPAFNQFRTKTGRLSSGNGRTSPNFQNIPSRSPEGKKVRTFLVPKPGYTMVLGDDSQIEARLFAEYMALLCDEWSLLETFKNSGLDFHSENTANWNTVSIAYRLRNPLWTKEQCLEAAAIDIHKYRTGYYADPANLDEYKSSLFLEGRNLAKTLIYGLLYGAGATKLGDGDYQRGKSILDGLYASMPAIPKLKNTIWDAVAFRHGYVYNMWGRRGYYPNIEHQDKRLSSAAERESFNYILQGSSYSRVATRVLTSYHLVKSYGASVFASEHDAMGYYCPMDVEPEFSHKLSQHFSHPSSLVKCPVQFEFHACPSWGDK